MFHQQSRIPRIIHRATPPTLPAQDDKLDTLRSLVLPLSLVHTHADDITLSRYLNLTLWEPSDALKLIVADEKEKVRRYTMAVTVFNEGGSFQTLGPTYALRFLEAARWDIREAKSKFDEWLDRQFSCWGPDGPGYGC